MASELIAYSWCVKNASIKAQWYWNLPYGKPIGYLLEDGLTKRDEIFRNIRVFWHNWAKLLTFSKF